MLTPEQTVTFLLIVLEEAAELIAGEEPEAALELIETYGRPVDTQDALDYLCNQCYVIDPKVTQLIAELDPKLANRRSSR